MSTLPPTASPGLEGAKRGPRGNSSGVVSIFLGVLFPAYILGAVFTMMGPLGLTNTSGDLLITGWPAVPRLLLLLLFDVPLLVGMWLGVRTCRRGARSAGRVGIWLSGVALLLRLFMMFLSPLLDAFEEGETPGFDWRAFLLALAVVAPLIRGALRAGRTPTT